MRAHTRPKYFHERPKEAAKAPAAAAVRKILAPADCPAAGNALGDKLPRERHGEWKEHKGRANPVDLLRKSDVGRTNEPHSHQPIGPVQMSIAPRSHGFPKMAGGSASALSPSWLGFTHVMAR